MEAMLVIGGIVGTVFIGLMVWAMVAKASDELASQTKDAPKFVVSPEMRAAESTTKVSNAKARGMLDMQKALLFALIKDEEITNPVPKDTDKMKQAELNRVARLKEIADDVNRILKYDDAYDPYFGGSENSSAHIAKLKAEYAQLSATSFTPTKTKSKYEDYRYHPEEFTEAVAAELLIDYERDNDAVFEFDVTTGQVDRKMFEAENEVFDAYISGGMSFLDRINEKKADLITIERRVLQRQHGLSDGNRLWVASNNALALIRNPQLERAQEKKDFDRQMTTAIDR